MIRSKPGNAAANMMSSGKSWSTQPVFPMVLLATPSKVMRNPCVNIPTNEQLGLKAVIDVAQSDAGAVVETG